MESADSRKRRQPRKQPSILTFFGSTPNKKRCTTTATDIGNIQPPDITMNSADHHEDAVALALDQASKNIVEIEILPTSNTLTAEKGKEDSKSLGTDIIKVVGQQNQEISPETKLHLIKNRQPETDFNFPPKQYKDSTEKGDVRQRYCSRDWFEMYDTLCYSKSTDELFCLCCVLFPLPAHQGQRAKYLIATPYRTWKDARSDLAKHINHQYHRDSKTKMDDFVQMMSNPSLIIQNRFSLEAEKQIAKNRIFLTSIIKCTELCGLQGIGLRGHRDDAESEALNQGNFKALLKLRVDAGDKELGDHLETCDCNATYISKTSQNELLQCIKKILQDVIIE